MKPFQATVVRPRDRLVAAALLGLASASALSAQTEFHTSPACWHEPRIYAEVRGDDPPLAVERVQGIPMPNRTTRSPNRAYAFSLTEQAIPSSGTSRVELTIYNERPYLLRILLPNVRGVDQAAWINEQLLFLRVWWGRIAGTDYIIDVESERVVMRQSFRYGAIAYQQFKQCNTTDWAGSETCACYRGAPSGWKPRGAAPDPD